MTNVSSFTEFLRNLFATKPPERPGYLVKLDISRLVQSLKRLFRK